MFYASVMDHSGQRQTLALGPFRTHGAALAQVDKVRRYVREHYTEGAWCRFGTARHKTAHEPGRFNEQIGYNGPGELP